MNPLSGTRILRVIFTGGTPVPLFQLTATRWKRESRKHLRRMIREDCTDLQASGSSEPAWIVNRPNCDH